MTPTTRYRLVLIAVVGHVVLASCNHSRRSRSVSIVPGSTTAEDLKAQKGTPIASSSPSGVPNSQVLNYPEHLTYQTQDGIVTAEFRDPAPEEKVLQYWRHLWIGDDPQFETLPSTEDVHGESLQLLKNAKQLAAVLYNPNLKEVVRVYRWSK